MDGWVTFGTKLDTKQLEQDLKQQERQLQQYEKEAEKLTTTKVKVEEDLTEYYEKKELIESFTDKALEYAQTEQEVADKLSLEKEQLAQLDEVYSEQLGKVTEINNQLKENAINQSLIKEQIQQTNSELNRSKGFGNIKDLLGDIGKETEKNIKKVGKWILALFGIRAMYGFIRNSINVIAENDEQLKTDIDYIRIALAYTLEPVVRKIIEWIKLLLQYLGYIVYMWTGKNIFENTNKGLKKATGQAKELKKQLAGFDEANVLSDNSGGAGGGSTAPSFDLTGIDKIKVPEWLQWIVDNGDLILAIVTGVVTALTLMKLGIDLLTATGFGLLIAGVVYAVANLINYLDDPSWKNFGKIIIGIGVALASIGIIIGAWPVVVAGVITAIIGLIIANWETIKGWYDTAIQWIKDKAEEISDKWWGRGIADIMKIFANGLQSVRDHLDRTFNFLKGLLDGIIEFIKGVFTGNWEQAFNGLTKIVVNAFGLMIEPIRYVLETIWAILQVIIQRIKDSITFAINLIKSLITGLYNNFVKIATNIGNLIINVINGAKSVAKGFINFFIDGLNKMINGINKIHIDKPSWLGGGSWGFNVPTIPRLAQGGIVNNPGKGVMMGNYIAGENREAVLPLTNPTTMAQLGEQIGKWVNLAIDNKMVVDGRVLATATNNQINKESFLMNR